MIYWWASRESNTAPTDYESAALTKHELEAQFFLANLHSQVTVWLGECVGQTDRLEQLAIDDRKF